jgi:hypothetical protein
MTLIPVGVKFISDLIHGQKYQIIYEVKNIKGLLNYKVSNLVIKF